MGTTIHGRGGRLYLAPDFGSDAVPITEARGWKIEIAQDLIENTQGFGKIWKQYLLASTGWKGSIDGNMDMDQATVFNAANRPSGSVVSGQPYGACAIYIYPSADFMTRYYYGSVWLNLSISASLTQTVRYSASFVGQGDLAQN